MARCSTIGQFLIIGGISVGGHLNEIVPTRRNLSLMFTIEAFRLLYDS